MRDRYVAIFIPDVREFVVQRDSKACVIGFKPVRNERRRRKYARLLRDFLRWRYDVKDDIRIFGAFATEEGDCIIFFEATSDIPV